MAPRPAMHEGTLPRSNDLFGLYVRCCLRCSTECRVKRESFLNWPSMRDGASVIIERDRVKRKQMDLMQQRWCSSALSLEEEACEALLPLSVASVWTFRTNFILLKSWLTCCPGSPNLILQEFPLNWFVQVRYRWTESARNSSDLRTKDSGRKWDRFMEISNSWSSSSWAAWA